MITNRTYQPYSYSSAPKISPARRLFLLGIAFFGIALGLLLGALTARAASPQDDLRTLNQNVEKSVALLQAGDKAGAQAAFQRFDEGWLAVEDGIKAQSRTAYRNIEAAMGDVKFAFNLNPFDQSKALAALQNLNQLNQSFIATTPVSNAPPDTATPNSKPAFGGLVAHLDQASSALAANDLDRAANEIKAFQSEWPALETFVAAKSAATYNAVENNMARAYAQLKSTPPDVAGAQSTINQLKSDLGPYIGGNNYGAFDAASVLLREGLEALLVIAALLTFMNKSGNKDKSKLIWAGAGLGVGASLVVAIMLQLLFAGAESAGTNRELLEGGTGLFAATLLFYMSYWLHSKSNINSWQEYIRNRSNAALATGGAFSLGLLAFLAVFREGAETALLYMGIAPSISFSNLILGLGIGLALLVALAVLILVAGMKLPMRPFFMVASILIYYIGFKFIGTSIHSLQVAGVLPATAQGYLPEFDFFGIYPTWETCGAQLALLLISALVLVGMRRRHKKLAQKEKVETPVNRRANIA